jgi:hypothetical protein
MASGLQVHRAEQTISDIVVAFDVGVGVGLSKQRRAGAFEGFRKSSLFAGLVRKVLKQKPNCGEKGQLATLCVCIHRQDYGHTWHGQKGIATP